MSGLHGKTDRDTDIMRTSNRIILAAVLASVMSFAGSPAMALTEKETVGIAKSIKEAPTAELAVKAAEIVAKAAKKEREATAVMVVRAAIARNAASAVSVVSSVIKAAPVTAPAVAAAAARLAPDQVEAIATAAALAAPELADKIVAAIVEVNPKAEERVAKAVMLAVPQAQAGIRQRKSGGSEANHLGETYSSSNTKIGGGGFPIVPPVQSYASPGGRLP